MIKTATLVLAVIVFFQGIALADLKLPTRALEVRVSEAELVFVGKLINKRVKGDWVQADLLVENPIAGVESGDKISVIWRATIDGRTIYDASEGVRGVAILRDKHMDRYWLRSDKFESLQLETQVIKMRKMLEEMSE